MSYRIFGKLSLLILVGMLGCSQEGGSQDSGVWEAGEENALLEDGEAFDGSLLEPDGLGEGDASSESDAVNPPGSRALVVAIDKPEGEDEIAVMRLQADGKVEDPGLRLPCGFTPREVTIRADGREALVVYVGTGLETKKGVVTVQLQPDGSTATVLQDLEISKRQSPTSIIYISDIEAVVSMRGPDGYELLALVRQQKDSPWQLGESASCGEEPLKLYPWSSEQLLVLFQGFWAVARTDVGVALRDEAGAWKVEEPLVSIEGFTLEMGLVPQKTLGALCTTDPETQQELNPKGLLHLVRPSAQPSIWEEYTTALELPVSGAQMAVSPDGGFAVINSRIAETNPKTGQVEVKSYYLMTISFDGEGNPTLVEGELPKVAAYIFDDFTISTSQALIIGLSFFDEQQVLHHQLESWLASSPGQWSRQGGALVLTGTAAAMAITPN